MQQVVFAGENRGWWWVDLACLSPAGYTLCGRLTIDIDPHALAVLDDPLRLVISNDDGTWLMPLPSPVCQ